MARFLANLVSALALVWVVIVAPAGAVEGSYSFSTAGFTYDGVANVVQDPVFAAASFDPIAGGPADNFVTFARAVSRPSRQSRAFVAPRTLDLPPSRTWGRLDTLDDHFARHGADFGATSADDYARQASDFFQRAQHEGLTTKIDTDGIIRAYDPATNAFGAFNPDGTTRTFFTPKRGIDYWNDQPGTAPWAG